MEKKEAFFQTLTKIAHVSFAFLHVENYNFTCEWKFRRIKIPTYAT